MVCTPMAEGGLGVIDLKTYSEALLLKYLHKFLNREDLPWIDLGKFFFLKGLIWEITF